MTIEVQGVGHVVLKVADLGRALRFYRDVLGLREVAREDFGDGAMSFLSTGMTHHDIGLVQVGPDATRPASTDVGLYHVALKIGDDLDALRAAKAHLEAHHVAIGAVRDHTVSQSIYVVDPDGNEVELYVEGDESSWRADPAVVATSTVLDL